jgi:hypothetical protein
MATADCMNAVLQRRSTIDVLPRRACRTAPVVASRDLLCTAAALTMPAEI